MRRRERTALPVAGLSKRPLRVSQTVLREVPSPNMTPRQKRNLTLAKQRRMEKARAAYAKAYTELCRLADEATRGGIIPKPEWYGQPPQGVTVQ